MIYYTSQKATHTLFYTYVEPNLQCALAIVEVYKEFKCWVKQLYVMHCAESMSISKTTDDDDTYMTICLSVLQYLLSLSPSLSFLQHRPTTKPRTKPAINTTAKTIMIITQTGTVQKNKSNKMF